jgi:hypothetical protein
MPCQLEDLLLNIQGNVMQVGIHTCQVEIGGLKEDGSILESGVKKSRLDLRHSKSAKIIHTKE